MNVPLLAPSDYSYQQKIKKNLMSQGFDLRPQFIDWAKELSPQEKRLLETLFDFVQEKMGWHGIYPSVKTLAWRSQMSLRNCHRVKGSLRRKGYIDWVTIRDPKTKQLKCHFQIKEKVLELKQRTKGERYSLPQLVKPFFDPKRGGDNLSQPVMSECHTNKYSKLPSEVVLNKYPKWRGASRPEQPLKDSFCGKTPVGGGGGGVLPETNSDSVFFRDLESGFLISEKTGEVVEEGRNPSPQSPPALAGGDFSDAQRQALMELALPKYLRRVGGLVKMEVAVGGVRARMQVPVHMVGQTLAELSGSKPRAVRKRKSEGGNPQQGGKIALKANKRKTDKTSPVVLKAEVETQVEETKSMSDELPFSKAKQVGRKASENLSREEKKKLKAKEYRDRQYEKQKAKIQEMKENGTAFKRPVSKKQSEKQKEASKLFQFFLARCKEKNLESYSNDLNHKEMDSALYMLDRVSVAEAEVAISWALDHWDELLEKDDRLSRNPYFYNLTAYHRFTYYLRRATVDSVHATKAEQLHRETGALIENNKSKGLRVSK